MRNTVEVRRRRDVVMDDPRMLGRYARSAWRSRVVGPLTARSRPGAVAVFHVGRCGSTVLTDQLGQHPEIHSDGETYVRVIEAAKACGRRPEDAGIDPVDYLAGRLQRSGRRWFLFDLKFDHVERLGGHLDDYLAGIDALGVHHWVVLRRSNLLAKLVSGLMAGPRGGYHTTRVGEVRPHRVVVDVDGVWMDGRLDSVTGHFDRIATLYGSFHRLSHERPVLELEYETDVRDDPRVAYRRTVEFLGLEPVEVDVRLQRLNRWYLRDVIENFDEVADVLVGGPHEWMLAD